MALKKNSDGTARVVRPKDGTPARIQNPNPGAVKNYPKSSNTSGGVGPNAKPYKGTAKG